MSIYIDNYVGTIASEENYTQRFVDSNLSVDRP